MCVWGMIKSIFGDGDDSDDVKDGDDVNDGGDDDGDGDNDDDSDPQGVVYVPMCLIALNSIVINSFRFDWFGKKFNLIM